MNALVEESLVKMMLYIDRFLYSSFELVNIQNLKLLTGILTLRTMEKVLSCQKKMPHLQQK